MENAKSKKLKWDILSDVSENYFLFSDVLHDIFLKYVINLVLTLMVFRIDKVPLLPLANLKDKC